MKATNDWKWLATQRNAPNAIRLRQLIAGADVDSGGNFRIRRLDGENLMCMVLHQADTTNNPDALMIIQEGSGDAISVRASASGSDVFSVDKSGNITAAGKVDLSNVSGDVFALPGTAITTAGTLSYEIPVDIGGTTYYLYAYTAGS